MGEGGGKPEAMREFPQLDLRTNEITSLSF